MDAALRALPSNGWTFGWTGRRDRALLVLSQMAGLSFQAISELTVADIDISDGIAVIRTPGGVTTLRSAPDGRICGPCALARWIHALDLTLIYANPGVVTAAIARAAPLTASTPHLCHSATDVCASTDALPVLPSIDQWGPCTAGSQQVAATASWPATDVESIGAERRFARPVLTRPSSAVVADPDARVLTAAAGTDRVSPTRPVVGTGTDPLPVQRTTVSPAFPRHLGLVRSNYSRADREHTGGQAARLADGLEGQAGAQLDRRVE